MKNNIRSMFLACAVLMVLLSSCAAPSTGITSNDGDSVGDPKAIAVTNTEESKEEESKTAEAIQPTAESNGVNQSPVFPSAMSVNTETEYKYDSAGRLMGGITTITILTPAIDPDGDEITYTWKGTEVDHYNQTTFPSDIDYDGLVATWQQSIIMGELASAIITVTASDGKGGETTYKLCMGTRVICN